MLADSSYGDSLTIEVVRGGFILIYPGKQEENGQRYPCREVFNSTRKLNQKVKEILETLSYVPAEKDAE